MTAPVLSRCVGAMGATVVESGNRDFTEDARRVWKRAALTETQGDT